MSSINGMFTGLRISSSGMRAQRVRQNVITSNLANAETTRTSEGGPYRREFVIFEPETEFQSTSPSALEVDINAVDVRETRPRHLSPTDAPNALKGMKFGSGVKIAEIRKDSREAKQIYNPSHPDANEEGYVAMPNINIVEEMADMIAATRAYEANVTAFNASKSMLMEALQI